MNIFSFTGNLGKDCRVGHAGSTAVCNFGVAVKSGYGDKAQTIWIDCAIFGKQAEGRLPDYLVKGQQVAVSGELGTREHDGRTFLTCRVNSIDLIGGKSDSERPQRSETRSAPSSDSYYDDEVPF